MELKEEPYDGPAATALIEAVQQEYVVRYGGHDDTPVDPAEFAPPNGLFLVGYIDAEPVAAGGLRRHTATEAARIEYEVKRMFVLSGYRGRGLSRLMLAGLEDRARALGASRIVLETGHRQPEAISLYETSGYQRIDGFGHYADAPLSVSFAKVLEKRR